MVRNRCHIHNLYWFDASGNSNCEAFFYITSIDNTTVNYTITSSEYPVYVRLFEGDTLVDINIHNEAGDYSFTGTFETDHIISYNNPCGADIVYLLEFDCVCPEGYVAVGDECRKVTNVAATEPVISTTLEQNPYVNYTAGGTFIYNEDWQLNGTGTIDYNLTTPFWMNTTRTGTTSDRVLNQIGVWASTTTNYQVIGFSICINISEAKTYYVGVSADNFSLIKINGVTILDQNYSAMYSSVRAQGYSGGSEATRVCWYYWHIYPVTIEAGANIIEVYGENITSVANSGMEIYDATIPELIAATSYEDLGDKLLFSSKDEVGNNTQLGNLGYGYECPEGYSLVLCEDEIVCRKIETVPCIPCMGALYNWYVTDDERKFTSSDEWVVPTDIQVQALEVYLGINPGDVGNVGFRGTNQGSKLAGSALLWNDGVMEQDPDFDSTGFNLIPSGQRGSSGIYELVNTFGYIWTSTEFSGISAYDRYVRNNNTDIYRAANYKYYGRTIRLLYTGTGTPTSYTGNDGKVYNVIQIGTQYWLAENLEETQYRNLDYILGVNESGYYSIDNTTWISLTDGAMCFYDDDLNNACKDASEGASACFEYNPYFEP